MSSLQFFLGLESVCSLEVPLVEEETFIGRGQNSKIAFIDVSSLDPQSQVSAVHASIILDKEKMLLKDQGSTNGTYLINPLDNSQTKLEANRIFPIRIGDKFVIGSIIVKVVS
jgi:pSer/pThr/pTyr-binding forkhead associated (FHA) protein